MKEVKTEPKKFIEDKLRCEICDTSISVRLCSGCHLVGYCSVKHQKEHWIKHKHQCLASITFKIEDDLSEIAGKCAVAVKDLTQGTVILEEKPIFHFNSTDEKFNKDLSQCITCGVQVKVTTEDFNFHRCATCFWNVCTPECEKATIHADNECKVLAPLRNVPSDDKKSRDFAISARGFSIRSREPDVWQEILDIMPFSQLDEFTEIPQFTENISKHGQSISEMKSTFPEFLEDQDKIVQYEILAQLTILSRRVGFHVPIAEDVHVTHVTIYKEASYFSNACTANCVWYIGPFPDFKIKIRAAVPIKKGEKLTVNRLGHLYFDTRNRQEVFKERFKRYCTCQLCSDPEELGTFQGSVACSECKNKYEKEMENPIKNKNIKIGHLVPAFPLDEEKAYKEDAEWYCNVCGDVQPASSFLSRLDEINEPFKDAATVNLKKGFLKWEIMKAMKEEQGIYLHKNHWIIQQAINTYYEINECPRWEQDEFHQVKPEIEERVERLTFLANILEKTCPGIQPERMRVLQALGDVMISLYDDACEKKNFGSITQEEAIKLETKLILTVQYLKEVYLYWQGMPLARGSDKNEQKDIILEKVHAAKRLLEHVEARLVEFRKEAEEIKDDKIEDWSFRYKKPQTVPT